jgi:adenosine deaminase
MDLSTPLNNAEPGHPLGGLVRRLPKAELHLHIEGSLEPELLFELANKNGVDIPFRSPAEVRAAYEFENLQSFLDIYYQGMEVLQTEDDYRRLMVDYLDRAIADGVRRAEIFFDPQAHTARGIDIGVVIEGLAAGQAARADAVSTDLILCFLRHLPGSDAVATLEAATPYVDRLLGVGLDSSEAGFPPTLFAEAYAMAAELGLRRVAHAGEEGPPEYVSDALDVLHVARIDHGVRSIDDPELVTRLATEKVPLTMCPLSNRRLQVTPDLSLHPLKRLMDAGVLVTVNSDDPSYFGGYVGDNYLAIIDALDLSADDVVTLARNSIHASFLDDEAKQRLLDEIEEIAGSL